MQFKVGVRRGYINKTFLEKQLTAQATFKFFTTVLFLVSNLKPPKTSQRFFHKHTDPLWQYRLHHCTNHSLRSPHMLFFNGPYNISATKVPHNEHDAVLFRFEPLDFIVVSKYLPGEWFSGVNTARTWPGLSRFNTPELCETSRVL